MSNLRDRAGSVLRLSLATAVAAMALASFGSSSAVAGDSTSWLCKPGQADNPCVGKLGGTSVGPDGTATDLGYDVDPYSYDPPPKPQVDCFYVYPTQSNQKTANANLNPDQELKDVAVNQARQFSRVCDVYAPLYRQFTFEEPVTPEVRDIAYSGVLQGWNDYLENYNDGRGVIIIGHSQGTSHLARMIADEVDPDPAVRDQVISAILPGANVYVRKGQKVGGQFQNIPACEAGDQIGCVIAYSMFRNEPAPGASFGRVESGYWINPDPRPDPADFEVLCVNPGELSGDDGVLKLLANLPVFLGQPEGARPWLAHPDFYRADCMSAGTADWLNVANLNHPGDSRADLANLVDDGTGNLHLGDVNLALDSLVEVAGTEADAYLAREALRDERKAVSKKLSKKQKQLKKSKKKSRKLGKKAKKANRKCKAAKKSGMNAAAKCKAARKARSKYAKAKKQVKRNSRQVKSLKKQLKGIDRKLS